MSKKRNHNVSMKVRVPGSKNSVEKMKYEIANEFGVNLGANASSRENGIVGGEITKRLVETGMSRSKTLSSSSNSAKKNNKKRSKKSSK